jgi:hypothetical protein
MVNFPCIIPALLQFEDILNDTESVVSFDDFICGFLGDYMYDNDGVKMRLLLNLTDFVSFFIIISFFRI